MVTVPVPTRCTTPVLAFTVAMFGVNDENEMTPGLLVTGVGIVKSGAAYDLFEGAVTVSVGTALFTTRVAAVVADS